MSAPRRGRGPTRRATARRTLLRNVVLALVVTMLVAAVVGTIALGGTDDEADTTTSTTTTTAAPELEGAAAELADLLELRQDQTYHARYEGRSGETSTVVIETWQAGGQVRQDQIVTGASQSGHLATIDSDAGQVRCTQVQGTWTCREAAPEEIARADPFGNIREELALASVVETRTDIGGEPAVCFEITVPAGSSRICARPGTGIPVSIAGGATELQLVLLEQSVDASVFEPPAPVSG